MIPLIKYKLSRLTSLAFHFSFFTFHFLLSSCISYHPVVKCEGASIEMSGLLSAGEDSLMNVTITPYKMQLNKTMNEVLAVSEQNLFKAQPEGLLGNFTADVILKKAREYCSEGVHSDKDTCTADICVLNNGGLRNPLPKGNITLNDVFQLMPFENEMVLLTLNGSEVKELIDFIANKGGMPVAGLRMKIKNQMADDVQIGEKYFDIKKSYTIVTSDYLAEGGDNMSFFANASRKIITGKKIRDCIVEYLSEENKKGNTIKVKPDGRIQYTK